MKYSGLLTAVAAATAIAASAEPAMPVVQMRGGIPNTMRKIVSGKETVIGFIGGSITEMNGYVEMTEAKLKKRFPKASFRFVRSGIASTCSDTGAFRIGEHILAPAGKIDLLMVDFAVNDTDDGDFSREHSIRGMEGIVRQVRNSNPEAEVVLMYFATEKHNMEFADETVPRSIAAFEEVAAHYALPSLSMAQQVGEDLADDKYDWKKFGGVHPAPFGNSIYADIIDRMFAEARPGEAQVVYGMPEPLDAKSFFRGRMVRPDSAKIVSGWTCGTPDWEKVPGKKRARYLKLPCIHAETPGAELELEFKGTYIGLMLTAGPDAGAVVFQVDGGKWMHVDTFSKHSAYLNYPYTLTLEENLDDKPHLLRLRISGKSSPASTGHAVRINAFAEN